jgi:hypothetical protein
MEEDTTITESLVYQGDVHSVRGSMKFSVALRWEKPTAEVAAAVENRINTSQKQIEEALEVLSHNDYSV